MDRTGRATRPVRRQGPGAAPGITPRTGLRRRELDRQGGTRAEQMGLAPDEHVKRRAVVHQVAFLVVGELDPDLPSAESKREGEFVPGARQPRREGQLAVKVPDPAEPEDER